ncbi:outer membrane protein TolC [Flavobacterium sp. 7E]|uniref:TolC family protein n=1 Tax=Flavobacterium sp. 7E TaxID=2735898 RepID=UPI0015711353|nr:TolC family protein [Flavobacterium sp. 7E]NRS87332.1 outer membrane protein TolC [Flavobacterium sp. 7E]
MQNIKKYILISCLILSSAFAKAQTMSLEQVLEQIKTNNPQLKMYDAEIQSMDASAKGARSWSAPQLSTGLFMTPYATSMWKADGMNPGMGAYMVGVTQMIPNASKLKADADYANALSSVEVENKNYTINELNALAKTNYYQWGILDKKIKIANENLLLLEYMIKSIEIRYKYNSDKLATYYKAKSQYSSLQSEIVTLQNEIAQRRFLLNTLMASDKKTVFEIDLEADLKDFNDVVIDTISLSESRSDIKAIEKTKELNGLKIAIEKSKMKPEFGVKYDHMFAFGDRPQQFSLMGMVSIPMPWSTKSNKATINSIQIKNESLEWQKQMILNEATGMLSGLQRALINLHKQYDISDKSIIPALKRNYDTAILAWQNNTGELFVALDSWEALNMAQLDKLDKLQAILSTQVAIEKQLETK